MASCFIMIFSVLSYKVLILPFQAAFSVLEKACEDYPRKLDVEINGSFPLNFMIPKFLVLTEHTSAKIRGHAVACLSYFVPTGSASLTANIDQFIA